MPKFKQGDYVSVAQSIWRGRVEKVTQREDGEYAHVAVDGLADAFTVVRTEELKLLDLGPFHVGDQVQVVNDRSVYYGGIGTVLDERLHMYGGIKGPVQHAWDVVVNLPSHNQLGLCFTRSELNLIERPEAPRAFLGEEEEGPKTAWDILMEEGPDA